MKGKPMGKNVSWAAVAGDLLLLLAEVIVLGQGNRFSRIQYILPSHTIVPCSKEES